MMTMIDQAVDLLTLTEQTLVHSSVILDIGKKSCLVKRIIPRLIHTLTDQAYPSTPEAPHSSKPHKSTLTNSKGFLCLPVKTVKLSTQMFKRSCLVE